MNATPHMSGHPAPQAGRFKSAEILFGVWGGPLAWYLQLCSNYALASERCVRDGVRVAAPLPALQWTSPAMIVAMLAGLIISLLALWVSSRAFRRSRQEAGDRPAHLLQNDARRSRFLALWGVLLSGAFAVATAMTAVSFIILPRCAG